ncbi:PP2C family serine/threonine-protein phosphatase [Bacillus solimangrovi]|uniref:PPM-type phosphatase domain-containing protein n=1 Tax=Bacillus solimangrovi TaxID=1305675 RepID=A0A1E5LG71_9BACI|nr:PP2C family serine/threonine-protein phosphatase [Bacillus solimangrovi]OEH93075.1 hypothetical protein BFG57_13555 [Bacillus solimangrovi]
MIVKDYQNVRVASFQQSKKGEKECGDSYYIVETDKYFVCAIADGLGSGLGAKESSVAVVNVIAKSHHESIDKIMEQCNVSLRGLRGAVIGILKIDYEHKKIIYSNVGNIRVILYSPSGEIIYPLPQYGYLSGRPQSYKIQETSLENNTAFIIYSDGLQLLSVKKFIFKMVSLEAISNELQKYVNHGNDDVTYVVGKIRFS